MLFRCSHFVSHRLLLEGGYEIDVVFTSRLKRAIRTVWIILTELNEVYLPVFKSWRLQERHYGALTGLSKKVLAEQIGADLVQTWCVPACACHYLTECSYSLALASAHHFD